MACKQVRFTTRYGEKVSFKSCGRKAKGRKAAHKRRRPKGRCRTVSFRAKGKRVSFRACR